MQNLNVVINSFILMQCSILVFFMFIGFMLFNTGLVRSKNTVTMFSNHLIGFFIVCLIYALLSQNIIYQWSIFATAQSRISLLLNEPNYSVGASLFYHMLFPCISLSIIAGCTAERLRLWPFLIFIVAYILVIYPIEAHWLWGKGYLYRLGFIDKSGASVVFLSAALCGLTGISFLGQRARKYRNHKIYPVLGANLPLAIVGAFLIALGSIGFNTGIRYLDENAINLATFSQVIVNTFVCLSVSVLVGFLVTRIFFHSTDLTLMTNAMIGAEASIAALPGNVPIGDVIFLGAIVGVLVIVAIHLLEKFEVDDPMGMFSSCSVGSLAGLFSVAWFAKPAGLAFGQQLMLQSFGILYIVLWNVLMSLAIWYTIKLLIGLRISESDENRGLDIIDCGMAAYPEFSRLGR